MAKRRVPVTLKRNDAWTVIGPGGGGTMIGPTVSPHDPDVVCLFCDMTGAYVSTDGGRSWRMFCLRNWVTCFAYDPSDPKVIYAANAALWRSGDTGRTWRMVWPDPARSLEHMRGDHADFRISTEARGFLEDLADNPPSGTVRVLAERALKKLDRRSK